MTAYSITLALHNLIRWLVLLAGLAAAGRALYAWLSRRPWTTLDNQLGLLFTLSVDVQLLLGLLLYVFLSPVTTGAFSDMGAAMSDPDTRFFVVEHAVAMLAVVILVHVGRATSRRASADEIKNRRAAIFYTLAIILILVGMPWFRPFLPTF